jgi:hypothetical protein
MRWNQRYRLNSYVRSSLWLIPLVAIPAGSIASRLVHWLGAWLDWHFLDLAAPGATALFQTIVTPNLSFVVFTFGSPLVGCEYAGESDGEHRFGRISSTSSLAKFRRCGSGNLQVVRRLRGHDRESVEHVTPISTCSVVSGTQHA